MTREHLTSPAVLAGLAVLLASLGLYLATLAPTLTWGHDRTGVDGGELLAAANTLGIPHPPGYPTYTLLLKLFATVVPLGDFAFRGNLMSAVAASVSVALLYWVSFRLCRHLKPDSPRSLWITSAALGSIVFAATPLFWSQAIMTEVYTLNTVFVGALLVIASQLVLRPEARRRSRMRDRSDGIKLALFGLLLGLGLGNHLTLLAVAVPLMFWLWSAMGLRRLASPWAIAGLVVGLGIYIYLPIRAAQEPAVNWGNADTVSGLAWMISGRVYQGLVFGVPVGSLWNHTVDWFELVFEQLNPLGVFLGLVGGAVLRSQHLKLFLTSLATIVALSVYSITYATVDSEVLAIPAFALFAVWVAVGFLWTVSIVSDVAAEAKTRLKTGWPGRILANPAPVLSIIALGALPATSVILNYSSQDLRNDDTDVRGAYVYARLVIESVPDGSVLLSDEEDTAFSLWYMGFVEETERDIAPVVVPLLQFDWYWRNISKRFPDRFPSDGPTYVKEAVKTIDVKETVKRIVEHNSGGASVFFTYSDSFVQKEFVLKERADGALLEATLKEAP